MNCRLQIVIWTTTPWTIPGNRAISFSPKIEYGLYEVTDAPADNWAKEGRRVRVWLKSWRSTYFGKRA